MKTQQTSTAPANVVVRQSIEVTLDRSDLIDLRLEVWPILGGWKWSVWNVNSRLRLAEDAGQAGTEEDAKRLAANAAMRVLRREVCKLDGVVDYIEDECEWR